MSDRPKTNTIALSKTTKFIVDNRGKTAPTAETGIALIATNCVSNERLYPSYERVRYVSQETYDTWFRAHPKPGDILLTNKGSQNGAICLVPDPVDFVIAQDMVALRANEKVIDPLFLFAALRSQEVQTQIKNLDVSGVIPHFKKTDFDKLFLPYPDPKSQKIIGRIYFALSAKIELNRRINETIEALTQAIFKNHFFDFDTKEVLPGWRESTIGEEVRVVGGSTPSTTRPEFWEGGVHHWATPKDLSNLSSPVLLETERRITEAGLQEIGSGLLPPGTVLLSSRAPIGYLVISEVPVAVNQGFIAMICDKVLPNYFVRLWTKNNIETIKGRANGTTFMEISKSNFRPLPVLVPPKPLLDEFKRQVEPLHRRMVSNLKESSALAALRDTLLPKLLSEGVPNPEFWERLEV